MSITKNYPWGNDDKFDDQVPPSSSSSSTNSVDDGDPAEVPPDDDDGCGRPTVTRDGGRAWVDTPLDSPYATRLQRFGAHFDLASARWWVGIAKADALEQLLTPPLGDPVDDPEPPQPLQRSAGALLVEMACEDYTLGVTDAAEPYGIHRDTPHVAMLLRGGRTGLRAELAQRFWDTHQMPAPQQALAEACLVLEGMAAKQDPRRVHLRIAEHDNQVHIDMGDLEGHVITICGGAWEIDTAAPVLFRRTRLTGEMPKPYDGGDYSKLWKFVPVPADDRPLVLAWLVQSLIQADVPHPVLALLAEHGAVKSTSARCLAQLVDPSPAPLRKAPRDADGWVTAANASWVVALDNISGEVPQWLSDCLCRAVTGDGDVRRALYTDSDVSVVAFRRAVIINGIDIQVTQGDLADRLLRVALPRINNGGRRAETAIAQEWKLQWPDILGGLLTLAAKVHQLLPSITVTDLPRMADYANVLAAVDQICGTEGLARYREQAKRVTADTLDHPFINALIDANYSCELRTASMILADFTTDDKNWRPPKGWPASARAVTSQLTRHAPALRAEGWEIRNDDGRNESKKVRWTLRPPGQPQRVCNPDPSNPSNPSEDDNTSSDSIWDHGLDHGLDGGPEEGDNPSNSSNSSNSSDSMPLTSEDELTGQTGYQNTPARVGEEMESPAGFEPPTGAGRCPHCGWHSTVQGHAPACPSK
jgi:hypothetical protein